MPSSAFPTSAAAPSAAPEPGTGERTVTPPGPIPGPIPAPAPGAAGRGPVRSPYASGEGSSAPEAHGARLHGAIRILQEKWVLHIVHALLGRPSGFNELGRAVGGCNPSTLAQRLQRLEALGLVRKEADGSRQRAGRGRYALTPAGEALRDVIDAIEGWASDHLASERADN